MNLNLFSMRAALVLALGAAFPASAWTPKRATLMTRFAAQVDPKNPLPEYPRPQLVRSHWQSLNGIWQYQPGKEGDALPTGKKLLSEICVPFAVESALSGVMEHHERLWYRRTFTLPRAWEKQQLKLHFGAVDYEAEVYVNGQSAGLHRGGYEPFTLDITRFLKSGGPQELMVRVFDPTDRGGQPRGKQTLNPQGIMYTPTTGIWQSVWLEPVAKTSIQNLHMVPDVDAGALKMTVNVNGANSGTRAAVSIIEAGKVIQSATLKPGVETAIRISNAKLWSPDRPFLYNAKVTLLNGKTSGDSVKTYFGMRKISVGKVNGVPRLLLNNKFVFQFGPLDQGFWPDGLYTAPTDAALKYDLEVTKQLGFNMTRKHIKVEPARWYHHADKLGLLVWQDLPSPNSYTGNAPPIDRAAYEKQLRATLAAHRNSPSIVCWVIFNEGQARHDTRKLTELAKSLDPSRLTNRDSGAGYERDSEPNSDGAVGDIDDVHNYPPPASPVATLAAAGAPAQIQALACGEYGGIGYPILGHNWKGDRPENWGYTTVPSQRDLEDLYGEYAEMIQDFRDNRGMSAAVYTQITDVEIEVNGLMTYDRLLKVDARRIALANRFEYKIPTYQPLLPTAETSPQTWKYRFAAPAGDWTSASYDDSAWQSGPGGFGTPANNAPRLGTEWTGDDIWMRTTFNPGALTAAQIEQLVVRQIHDDGIEVFINGVLAFQANNAISGYENKSLSPAARRAIVPNAPNTLAVHCRETGGDQYVDVGVSLRIPQQQ